MANFDKKKNTFPRFLVISSLPIALFVFTLLGYLKVIPLKVELHSLIIIFLILFIFVFFVSHNAWYSFAIFKNRIIDKDKEIESYLSSRELSIRNQKKSYASLDDYFENFLKDLRNDNFANIASSIFPTLGILGTFTAIAISMPDFTVDSKQALESEITILLSGVGTAFYASIYGIFLSIWWVFFEKRGLTKIENEINYTKNFYKDRVWTKEELEIAKILQNSEGDFIKKMEAILTPDYITSLDNMIKHKLEYLAQINRAFVAIESKISTSYSNLSIMFESSVEKQEKLLESFESIQKSIEKINQNFEDSLANEKTNQKALKAETYSVLSSLEMVSSDLKELGKDLINAK